ncbi:MAG: trigger factor [bacterium]|nr:trigger factor [bacterium]
MKSEIKKLPHSIVEISVEVPQIEMAPFWDLAAQKLAQNLTIKGFRTGKAPRDLIEKTVGTEKFFNKAAELAVERTYREIAKKNGLEPIDAPEITVLKISPSDDFNYRLKTAVLPEIILPDYENLIKSMSPRPQKIEPKEVDEALEWLRQSRVKLTKVERPAKIGDLAEIDFEIRFGGVKLENGAAKNQPLVLGEHRFIPGLEENIIGLSKGEEKEFSLKIPDDFWEKRLAGKIVDFKVKMGEVSEREVPEINDEFAKSAGQFDNLEGLKKNIGEGLLAEKETKEKEKFRIEMADKIADKTEWDLPEILIEREIEKMFFELRQDVENRGLPFGDYLGQIKKTDDDLKKEFKEPARRRVKIALVLRTVAKKEKIEPAAEEIEQKLNEVLKSYSKTAEKDLAELYEKISAILINEKVFEHLESLVNYTANQRI